MTGAPMPQCDFNYLSSVEACSTTAKEERAVFCSFICVLYPPLLPHRMTELNLFGCGIDNEIAEMLSAGLESNRILQVLTFLFLVFFS